jgi:hypothetical protein
VLRPIAAGLSMTNLTQTGCFATPKLSFSAPKVPQNPFKTASKFIDLCRAFALKIVEVLAPGGSQRTKRKCLILLVAIFN